MQHSYRHKLKAAAFSKSRFKSVLQVNVYEKSVCVISEIIGKITYD